MLARHHQDDRVQFLGSGIPVTKPSFATGILGAGVDQKPTGHSGLFSREGILIAVGVRDFPEMVFVNLPKGFRIPPVPVLGFVA